MFDDLQKFKQISLCLLLLQLAGWALMFLAGCSGNTNIPSAGILAGGRVKLTWHDVPGAAAYNVYLSRSPGVTVFNSLKIPNVTNPIAITDLEPGITYYFVVAAEDDSGQIRWSKEVSQTISDAEGLIDFGDILSRLEEPAEFLESKNATAAKISDQDTAAKPALQQRQIETGVAIVPTKQPTPFTKAEDAETRDVTLAWDDVPNTTSYNIYWRDKPGVTKKNGTKIANVKNPHKVGGLKKGITYYFVVTAVNASGESEESEEFSFTVGQ